VIGERAGSAPTGQQRQVMDHGMSPPAVVDAGAGTGKTYTIVERVAHLQSSGRCDARSILLLTFSRKAAAELRGRIIRRLGPGIDPPECATFHAFALSVLKEHAFELDLSPDSTLVNDVDARVEFWNVFDEFVRGDASLGAANFALRFGVSDDLRTALFDIRQQLRDTGVSLARFEARALAAADAFGAITHRRLYVEMAKGDKTIAEIGDDDFRREMEEERARAVAAATLFQRFDDRLRERNAMTYADLLDIAERAVRELPSVAESLRARYRHCIVDEYQDTDPRQVRLLKAIFGDRCERVMVVGDPRQSIYAFRGARPDNVTDFQDLPDCTLYSLTDNRRSRQEILDLAHSIISRHTGDPAPLRAVRGPAASPVVHAASTWAPRGERAPRVVVSREREARWVAAKIVELLASGRTIERLDEPGSFEPISPRHIAILSRNKTKLRPLIDALHAHNIPFRQYGGAGFYDAPEVLDALAWFRLTADPLDDNAVARVLSAPSIGLADASITELCRDMPDGGSLCRAALIEPLPAGLDAAGRARIERLRNTIAQLEEYSGAPLAIAWEAMLDRSGLVLAVEAAGGERRDQARANIEKLSAMVRTFADRNLGARAVDFTRYVHELDRANAEDQEADPPSADAVSLMTIHAAKGLEWPVVFVVDVWPRPPAGQRRAWIDSSGALLVSEGSNGKKPFHAQSVSLHDNGTGLVRKGPGEEQRADREREERRLFYVALTRARDELYVSGPRLSPSATNPAGKPSEYLAEVLDWIERRSWQTIDEPAARTSSLAESGNKPSAGVAPPLGDFLMGRVVVSPAVPVLSFSTVAQFELCPRQANYRLAYRLPRLARGVASNDSVREASTGTEDGDDRPQPTPHSLLSLGVYGELVHLALELWARKPDSAGVEYVREAVETLGIRPSKDDRARGVRSVDAAIGMLTGWRPVLIEAPFALDFDGTAVSGFIDLVAEDPAGRAFVLDYKTGAGSAQSYALQLGLYRQAAGEAYGLRIDGCRIIRVTDDGCAIETVDLPALDEIAARVGAAARGIRDVDLTPLPGEHCSYCPYRAAPCQDFQRETVEALSLPLG
jgi:superfamily I DNA/RNA helicase